MEISRFLLKKPNISIFDIILDVDEGSHRIIPCQIEGEEAYRSSIIDYQKKILHELPSTETRTVTSKSPSIKLEKCIESEMFSETVSSP